MASTPYFNLLKQSEKLSKNSSSIIVVVKGIIEKSTINSPFVVKLAAGKCNASAI